MSIAALIGTAGAGQVIENTTKTVAQVIDDLWTSKEEKLTLEEARERMQQIPALAQVELTKEEAKHASIFVAGWRPFVGWVCGSALAYNFIFRDLVAWAITVIDPTIPMPPPIAFQELSTILLGMLGLGTMRTFEKVQGADDSAKSVRFRDRAKSAVNKALGRK